MIQARPALWLTASVTALALGFGATTANAADETAATAGADNTVSALTITAERRTENLQTTNISASAITGDQLQDRGVGGLDALQFITPSLTVADFGQGNLFNIRGIGKSLTNVQTPSGVVTYWDGVASFPGFFQDEPYYDLAGVEVLRGPQGTFAGQNATGGAVFINTNSPSLSGIGGYIEGQYGNYNDVLIDGALNVPFSDTLAGRIAFSTEHRNSFYTITGPFTGHPGRLVDISVRGSLLWQPTPAFKAILKFDYNDIDHGGYPADPTLNPANPTQLNPADLFHISNNAPNQAIDKFGRVTLNMAYTFESGILLRSISSYAFGDTRQAVDLDGASAAPLTFSDIGLEKIYSEEVNLVSPDKGPLRWVIGGYYQHDNVDLPKNGGFDIGVPHGAADIILEYHTPKTTEAVFGQVSYDITPALQFQVGARYTHETFNLRDQQNTVLGLGTGLDIVLPNPGYTASTSNSGFTGKVALNWTINPDNFVYIFAARGRKAGGINTTPTGTETAPLPFAPEVVNDFEAGWKPTFADGHVRAQFDVFYSQYKKFQLQFAVPNAPTQSDIRNADGTTAIYGVEAEAQASFGAFSMDIGGAYIHSSLGSFVALDPVGGATLQLGGRQEPLSPSWTFNVGAQYAFALGNGATLTPRVDFSYVDHQWSTPYQDFGDLLPSRSLVNAQLAYDQGPWSITGYATNLGNLHYVIAANVGLRYAGAPRQFGVRVARKF